jgi:hypothetical protein
MSSPRLGAAVDVAVCPVAVSPAQIGLPLGPYISERQLAPLDSLDHSIALGTDGVCGISQVEALLDLFHQFGCILPAPFDVGGNDRSCDRSC